jgi:hypothetical protein
MNKATHSIVEATPAKLLSLLDETGEEKPVWDASDMHDIFSHQWAASLSIDLSGLGEALQQHVQTLAAAKGLLLRSFGDLLEHPHPPLELLMLAKEFSKRCLNSPRSPIPDDIARVLYFATIAAALGRGSEITTLSDNEKAQGMRWALSQTWLDGAARDLISHGLEILAQKEGGVL